MKRRGVCQVCMGRRFVRATATISVGGLAVQTIEYEHECPRCAAAELWIATHRR